VGILESDARLKFLSATSDFSSLKPIDGSLRPSS